MPLPFFRRRGPRWAEDCTKIIERCKRCVCETGDRSACVEIGACKSDREGGYRGYQRIMPPLPYNGGGPWVTMSAVGRPRIFAGYGKVDPNLIVSTVGTAIGDIWGRFRQPPVQYIAPPSPCSMFERADPSGVCKPNYAVLFAVVAGTIVIASVGARRGR